jgi:enoyl-CoA hydratase/carnithine racemase
MNPVKTERIEGVLVVTLDRPERLNALDRACHDALDSIWTDYDADPSLRCAIITGAGDRAFCAGSDLKAYGEVAKITLPENGYAGLAHRRVAKPIIAAVNGLALGGGFELVLCCDLVIASENATFALPEVRIGGAPFGGGLPRLVRKLPYNVALGLLLTARNIDAAEGYRIGLVNEVAPPDQLMETAMRWAREIMLGAPLAIITTKEMAEATMHGDEAFESLVGDVDDARQRPIIESADFKEAVAAFAEKRVPVWQGR